MSHRDTSPGKPTGGRDGVAPDRIDHGNIDPAPRRHGLECTPGRRTIAKRAIYDEHGWVYSQLQQNFTAGTQTVEICICRFWWPYLHATYELQRATTIKRELPKFGRNDPCP